MLFYGLQVLLNKDLKSIYKAGKIELAIHSTI